MYFNTDSSEFLNFSNVIIKTVFFTLCAHCRNKIKKEKEKKNLVYRQIISSAHICIKYHTYNLPQLFSQLNNANFILFYFLRYGAFCSDPFCITLKHTNTWNLSRLSGDSTSLA